MKECNANEDKLIKVMNTPWFAWGMTLFWALFAYNDYRNRRFSWIDGLLVAAFGVRPLVEVIVIVIHRRRKNATK